MNPGLPVIHPRQGKMGVHAIGIDFADHLPAGDVEKAIAWLDTAIKRDHPRVKRVFEEPEDSGGASAARCRLPQG